MMRLSFAIPAAALLITGCASTVPQAIREAPASPVTPAQVQAAPDGRLGQRVRWGGTILDVHNRERVTEIEVLARPLDAVGEPRGEAAAQGRFLARIDRFVDPAEYPKDRLLTVSGTLAGVQTRSVGDYPYRFPVVAVEALHLWPEPVDYPYAYSAWPSPWYDPWYPWHRPFYPWYGGWYGGRYGW